MTFKAVITFQIQTKPLVRSDIWQVTPKRHLGKMRSQSSAGLCHSQDCHVLASCGARFQAQPRRLVTKLDEHRFDRKIINGWNVYAVIT